MVIHCVLFFVKNKTEQKYAAFILWYRFFRQVQLTWVFALWVYAGSGIVVFSIFIPILYRVGRAWPDWKWKCKNPWLDLQGPQLVICNYVLKCALWLCFTSFYSKMTLVSLISTKAGKQRTSGDDVLWHLAGTQGHCLLIVLLRRRCCGQWGRRISWVRGWGVCAVLLRETHKHNSQISSITRIIVFLTAQELHHQKDTEYNLQN